MSRRHSSRYCHLTPIAHAWLTVLSYLVAVPDICSNSRRTRRWSTEQISTSKKSSSSPEQHTSLPRLVRKYSMAATRPYANCYHYSYIIIFAGTFCPTIPYSCDAVRDALPAMRFSHFVLCTAPPRFLLDWNDFAHHLASLHAIFVCLY
jgi:hypothetical protein